MTYADALAAKSTAAMVAKDFMVKVLGFVFGLEVIE
jgi:hypothetical protein